MQFLRVMRMRLRSLFRRDESEDETRRELELHVEQLTREKVADGMSVSDARAAALRQMGNLGVLREHSRDARRVRYLHDLVDDLRFAARMLCKSPGFTTVAVLSLGLGIGANTAIFTLIKRSYLEMLPVRNPEQIVRVATSNKNNADTSFSYPLYRELAAATNTPFEGFLCTSNMRVSLAAGNAAESISIQLVSGNFYEVLGVQPFVGRLLSPEDDRHPGGHPVIVLSHNYWRRRFGADTGIVGKTVRVNTYPMTVIGVSPPRFDGLDAGRSPDGMVPVMMQAQMFQRQSWLGNTGESWLGVVGRLKPGVLAAQAELALTPVLQAHQRARQPGNSRSVYESHRIHVRPIATGWHRNPKSAANSMALLGITAVVLLAACTNLANLLMARAAARRNEIAVRLAVGAARMRLVRQLLTESLLLAVLGGALGLALAIAAGPAVVRLALGNDPQVTQNSSPDMTILLFCLGVAVLCGVLFGLAPITQAVRVDVKQGFASGRTVAGTRLVGRKLLLSVQISLTLLLLNGAALFVRTLRNMQTADLGFLADHLIQVTLLPTNAGYEEKQVLPYFARTMKHIRQLPGVVSASIAAVPVMAGSGWSSGIRIEGVKVQENDPGPNRNAVGANYFSTMRIPIVLGREFDERDSEDAPKVAIVNDAFARFYFGSGNPIGRRIDESGSQNPPRFTIIGVAKDGKYKGVRDTSMRFWYIPVAQSTMRNFLTLYVRTTGDPTQAITDVRRAIASVDVNVATMNLRTVESQIAAFQRFERMIATLASFLGGLAVILAAIGLYGVLSYSVNQRQREIGIRMSLGATPSQIARLVVSAVAAWAALGVGVALPAVYYASNAVRDVLYEVPAMDPVSLLWAAGTLAAVACIAAWLPARRAALVRPAVALHAE